MPVVACHDGDLLKQLPDKVTATLLCARCGAVLHRHRPNSIDRSLALTLSALTLFIVALSFPFLAMKSGGFVQESRLLTGIRELWRQGLYGLAILVLLTCVLVPLGQIAGLLYLLSTLFLVEAPWLRLLLVLVALAVILYLLWLPTRPESGS